MTKYQKFMCAVYALAFIVLFYDLYVWRVN